MGCFHVEKAVIWGKELYGGFPCREGSYLLSGVKNYIGCFHVEKVIIWGTELYGVIGVFPCREGSYLR